MDQLRGLLLIPDGVVTPIYLDLLGRGDLPNISEHLYERSLITSDKALSTFPSSTFEAMQSLLTGKFPYDPGATFMVRQTGEIVDRIRHDNPSKGMCIYPTIFDLFGRDEITVSIHLPWNDGAKDKHPAVYRSRPWRYVLGWGQSNKLAADRFAETYQLYGDIAFSAIWFPALDRFGHTLNDRKLRRRYIEFDQSIGRIMQTLRDRGVYDETITILVSDHSMGDVHSNVNPNMLVRDAGFTPRIWRTANDYDSVVVANGYGTAGIYLHQSHTDDLDSSLDQRIQALLSNDAIAFVIRKMDNGTRRVFSERGSAEITKDNGTYTMNVDGGNPFGYSDTLTDRLTNPHTEGESLVWTIDEEIPDGTVSIAESMHHPRSPDLLLVAADGYAFGGLRNYHPQHRVWLNSLRRRGHGTLSRSHREVPLVISGPDMDFEALDAGARIMDWVPTFLHIAGRPIPPELDAMSLVR